jgi:chromosome segregation ATPase
MKELFIKYFREILILVFGITIVALLIGIFKPSNDNSELIKFKLDTLNKEIEGLYNQQKSIDSCIRNTNDNIKKIDNQIDSIKIEKTTINNVFNSNSTKIKNFDAKQTDSLLKIKYRY